MLRPNIFNNLTSKEIREIITYRFSHAGISDLYDHVDYFKQHWFSKGDSQKEGGDIENQQTSYVTKEVYDLKVNQLETDNMTLQNKMNKLKTDKETLQTEMKEQKQLTIELKTQVETLLKKHK